MQSTALLQPVVALLILSAVMWCWMYATRIPAIRSAGMKMEPELPIGVQMSQLPARVRWKADNYNHLNEHPTVFYAVILCLYLLPATSALDVTLAWIYVGLRVAHSLIQALWNNIEVRFAVFALSGLVQIVLVARAAMQVF